MRISSVEIPSSALSDTGRVRPLVVLAWLLGFTLLLSAVGLVFIPWQQSVRGEGRVIAYAPLERRQMVEAPIEGRVVNWFVQEGDRVEVGQPIAELSDNDPEVLDRLRRERDSARTQADSVALSIALTEARVLSLQSARDSAIAMAEQRTRIAQDQKDASLRAVDAAEAALETAKLNIARQRTLHEKGLTSRRDLELAELAERQTHAEWDRARAALSAANANVEAQRAERNKVASDNSASIDAARSAIEALKADKAKAEAALAQVEVRLARQQQMNVVAPRSGVILRLLANQDTDMVKAGEALVELVPEAETHAVELYVDGNDAPLIDPGRSVRVQFEGWPAVQFVGWPSVAVGTFAGQVAFVDSHDDGKGRFRVVVVPEPGEDWPEARYLRQGVRANGWVLLNQVSLGFELWRIFNGFPPALEVPGENTTSYGAKQ